MNLVDCHCHLDLPHFDEDRDQVLARAQAAGVRTIITIGIDIADGAAAVALAESYPQVYAAVGVHPNDCADFGAEALADEKEAAAAGKVDT